MGRGGEMRGADRMTTMPRVVATLAPQPLGGAGRLRTTSEEAVLGEEEVLRGGEGCGLTKDSTVV